MRTVNQSPEQRQPLHFNFQDPSSNPVHQTSAAKEGVKKTDSPANQEGHLRFTKYNTIKAAAVIVFCDPKNIFRGAKIAFLSTAAVVMQLAASIIKPFSESTHASLHGRIAVIKDSNAHTETKIANVWVGREFGDRLLVTTRNIGKREVLVNEAAVRDKINSILDEKFILEKSENKESAEGKVNLAKALDVEKFILTNPDSRIRDGVCFATSMSFIRDYLNRDENKTKEALVQSAEQNKKGVSTEICALHAIYAGFNHIQHGGALDREFGMLSDGQITSARYVHSGVKLGQIPANELTVAHALGLKPEIKANPEDAIKEKIKLHPYNHVEWGGVGRYKNTQDHLERGGFSDLKPGAYQLSFSTGEGKRAVVYIKEQNGEGYLMDPNIGLIQCQQGNHIQDVLDMLSRYPEPDHANGDQNYEVEVVKYQKSNQARRAL